MTLEQNIERAFGQVLQMWIIGTVWQEEAERLTLLIDDSSTEEDTRELLEVVRRLVGGAEA